MGVNTQKYIRKPLYVDAVRVTDKNFDEIVAWCQGEVETEEVGRKGTLKKFIRVRVHNPKNPRQTKAFIGDWVLYTERGYKVYKDVPFCEAFDLVADVESNEVKLYIDPASGELIETPPHEGAKPLSVGELMNTIRSLQASQVKDYNSTSPPDTERILDDITPESFGPVAEEPNQETGVQPIESVEHAPEVTRSPAVQEIAKELEGETTPQGEPIEVVEATPQAIADAANEQAEYDGGTPESEGRDNSDNPVGAAKEERIVPVDPAFLEDSPQPGDEKDHWDSPNPLQPEPVSKQPTPDPDAAAGKYVLSEKEQADLGPEGVRELIASGEAVLAQDLA